MIKALLLALLTVAGPVQAQLTYICSVSDQPAGDCCPDERQGTASAYDMGGMQEEVSCVEPPGRLCMEPAVSEADRAVSSASSDRDGKHDPPPTAILPPIGTISALAPKLLIGRSDAAVVSAGAGRHAYLLTQRLRI